MEESADSSEFRPSALSVSEVFSDHDDDKMELVDVDGLLDGDITAQEKNKKKKKKHKGGLLSPRQILAFNTSELSKLDEHKAEMQKFVVKSLSRSASFPSNAKPKNNFPLVEGSGDSEDSRDHAMLSSAPVEKIFTLARVASFPLQLKSALRGGYEELGIGPRPKLQVKWASSVWEPPCSTTSHTVNRIRSKKDPKHVKKGKSSHNDAHKRQDKKKHRKTKCHLGSSNVRRHGVYYNDRGKEAESLLQAENLNGNEKPLAGYCGSAMVLPELESKGPDASDESGNKHGPNIGLSSNSESSVLGGAHYLLESTCGGSLFEPERLACNVPYRQAM